MLAKYLHRRQIRRNFSRCPLHKLFSQKYHHVIDRALLEVEIPEKACRMIWAWLLSRNTSLIIQLDPNDSWISDSSILEEVENDYLISQGWDTLPVEPFPIKSVNFAAFRQFVLQADGFYVFDVLELVSGRMEDAEKEQLRQRINQIFDLHNCAWRISDGEFFKLDADFVGERLASIAHDVLVQNQFAGAADEYANARRSLVDGKTREVILNAGHSFESVMKVLTKLGHANGGGLIKELGTQGYFDDLPSEVRAGFMDQVLKALPFLRNKLGGHGRGKKIVSIPVAYGSLVIQIAAAFHNFLIAKHLERLPSPPVEATPVEKVTGSFDDEIPF